MPKPEPAQVRDNWKLLPRRVLIGALIVDAFLAIAYALTADLPKTPTAKPLTFLFGLNGEGNIPAWFSGAQLLLIGLAFLVLASWIFQSDERIAALRRLFFTVGLAFVYLSADEVGQVHEKMSAVAQSWHPLYLFEIRLLAAIGFKRRKLHGGSIWIPLFAIVGLILLIWLWPQIKKAWKLWRKEILLLALGFAILALGATVVETVGNLLHSSIEREVQVGIEEMLELVGASVMLYAAMRVLAATGARLLPPSLTSRPGTLAEEPAPIAGAGAGAEPKPEPSTAE
jgi:hypothetical protein